MADAALALTGVSSGYGDATVLRDVSLEVGAGEIVALMGKNGMGKTTLVRSAMGYLAKSAGRVSLSGTDVTSWPPHRIARLGVGYIPQEKALFQDLTVEENLRLALPMRHDWQAACERVRQAFPFLLERLGQRAGTLSGGEQKMLLMSRALACEAKLILVDEITEGLQPSVIERLAGVIRDERIRSGTAFLLVEQHIGFSLEVADRYAVLEIGALVHAGRAKEAGAADRVADHLSV